MSAASLASAPSRYSLEDGEFPFLDSEARREWWNRDYLPGSGEAGWRHKETGILQLGFVLLVLAAAIGLTISLLPLADMCRRASLVVWRWLITYTGPQAYPRFWHVIHGFFPLACVALAIGAWLLLAASPEMAEGVAAEPIADLTRLGTGLSMIGVFGCAMRGLHFAALRTPQAPPASTPKRRRTSSKSAVKTVGKTRTRKSSGTQRPRASGQARRDGKASAGTSKKKRRQG